MILYRKFMLIGENSCYSPIKTRLKISGQITASGKGFRVKSDDDGKTWSEPIAAAYRSKLFRCYDPCLWIDPLDRLWFIWALAPNRAVYAAVCDEPDAEELVLSP